MVYYPKSHITPDLYSNGDLVYKNTDNPYTGYYFSTYDNKAFTGRFPGDGDNLELNRASQETNTLNPTIFEDANPEDTRFYPENSDYTLLKKIEYNKGITRSPLAYYPQPSKEDYETGEIIRYFSKKVNEPTFVETVAPFQNSLYIQITLPWSIRGDKDKVYQTNKNIVELKELKNKAFGLGIFLKHNYIQFYK